MTPALFPSFRTVHASLVRALREQGQVVAAPRWQGVDVSAHEGMRTVELLDRSFCVDLGARPFPEDLGALRADVRPNLPWADDHFAERVGGEPLNPGEEWKRWPWGNKADAFRADGGQFTHTYQERYWPRWAGLTADGRLDDATRRRPQLRGVRYPYGDLGGLVVQLARDPLTRQAYLPIWFPEDTGVAHGGRVPCSLGYHLLLRDDALRITYYIRSCDLVRHFRDDCYLTVRLLLWTLDRLRELTPAWRDVRPGRFTMHIASLHAFVADRDRGLLKDE